MLNKDEFRKDNLQLNEERLTGCYLSEIVGHHYCVKYQLLRYHKMLSLPLQRFKIYIGFIANATVTKAHKICTGYFATVTNVK
jgi:hypothetical protein